MAERDYRVTYRTRGADDDEGYDGPRRRLPTALDPYLYPEDRDELKRNVAMAKTRNRRYRDDPREYEVPSRANTIRDDQSTSAVKYNSRPATRTTTYDDGVTTVALGNVKENARPSTMKTTYSVTQAGLEKESEVTMRPKASAQARPDTVLPRESISRRQSFREHDEIDIERERSRGQSTYRERDEIDIDVERSKGPSRYASAAASRYDDRKYSRVEYEVERPRPEGGAYVIDARGDDVLDVYVGSKSTSASRGFAGYRNDPNDDDARSRYSRAPPRNSGYSERRTIYAERDEARASTSSLQGGGPYASGARPVERTPTAAVASKSQASFKGPSRAPTRAEDDFHETDRKTVVMSGARSVRDGPQRASTRVEEHEYGVVEDDRTLRRTATMSEDFREPFGPDPTLISGRGRARADTFEDDYVMVSPPRKSIASSETTHKTSDTLRSAMVRDDTYTSDERQRRRRSRSISFRDADVEQHYVGDRFHQRPGTEAALAGKYLNHYEADDRRDRERVDYEYSDKVRRDVKGYDRKERDSRYVEEDKYGPQRVRSRSRRRRDDDDESYVSRNYEKTVKTTYL